MKIARLLESAPEAIDQSKLEKVLRRHNLLEAWKRLQPALPVAQGAGGDEAID